MDELPDLPEFRNNHPVGGGTLRRIASTPLSFSLSGSTLNTSSNGGIVQSSSPTMVAAEDPRFSGSSGRNYFDGPYRSPSSSPPSRHLLHHQQQRQEIHGKDLSLEVENLREDINPSSAIVSAQRSIPSPPPGTHISDGSTGNNGEAVSHHHHPRARKMPSTPSLGQHRTGKSGSTSSNSTASSPPSDADMLEDDEDVGEDEETNDASHYALSPWAKAPKDIADARAAAVRARSAKSGHKEPLPPSSRHELQPFQERAFTPHGDSSDQGLKSQHHDDEADPLERKQSRQQTEGAITEALRGGPVLAMDAEGAVVAIGEIPHSTEVGSTINTTGGGSRENHGTGRSTDVTTIKGLDSGLSEFGEDDSMQTDEVNENRTTVETERKDGRSEEGENRPDHEASLGAKDMKVDRNPMQNFEGKQGLEQEDSVMAEI